MKQEGIDKKEWITTLDGETREDHERADGQIVEVKETFAVGGEDLRYPGDTTASPDQTVNCRCATAGGVEEDKALTPEQRALVRAIHLAAHRGLERPWAKKLAAHFVRTGRKVKAKLLKVKGLPQEE